MGKMLIIVDPQYDFITGSLPVPSAEPAMNALAGYLRESGNKYSCKLVSCDWHPYGHCSFRQAGGEWPRHCVRNTCGAAIWEPLVAPLHESGGEVNIIYKGQEADREEYSFLQAPGAEEFLLRIIGNGQIDSIDICGLAGDICVLNTARDVARIAGKDKLRIIEEFSPCLDGGSVGPRL